MALLTLGFFRLMNLVSVMAHDLNGSPNLPKSRPKSKRQAAF